MKLYIKQKVFSWRDRFTVKTETGGDRYFVEGELFSFGKKLRVYDAGGTERACVRQRIFSFMPRFHVFIDGRKTAEIVKRFTFFTHRYFAEGLGWEIDGDFSAHDYEIRLAGRRIALIHKKWMAWGDCYELDIASPADALSALTVVLAIDCAMETGSSAS
jgi:uncharacterized protein YxjI